MRARNQWCVGAVVLGLLAFCGCSKVDLKFQPKEGDSRAILVTSNTSTNMTMMGQNTDQSQTTSMAYTCDVESVGAAGEVAMKVTIDNADLGDMGGMMGAMGGGGGNLSGSDIGLSGSSFNMTVGSDGRVAELTGMGPVVEEAIRKVIDEMKKQFAQLQLPEAQLSGVTDGMGSVMRRTFGDSAMREMMEDLMRIYPDAPLATGSSWQRGVVLTHGPMPMVRSENWKLVSSKDGVATLEVTANLTPNTDAAGINMGMISISYEVSGQVNGTYEVDEATGWLIKGEVKKDLDVAMKMTGMPAGAGGPSSMKITWTDTIQSSAK